MEITKEYRQLDLLNNNIFISERKRLENKGFGNAYLATTALLGIGTYFAGAGSEGAADLMYSFAPLTGIGTLFSAFGAYKHKIEEKRESSKLQKLKQEYKEKMEIYKEKLKGKRQELEGKVTESLKPRTKSLVSKSKGA